MNKEMAMVPFERIASVIHVVRGQKVMLDRDLAGLYGVPTKALKQAVRRNLRRFPPDFMFELRDDEFSKWRSQFVTSKADRMGLRYVPMAFTEQGVAMLSSILNSQQAIEINVAIMRAFVRLRQFISSQSRFAKKLREMEQRIEDHHESIQVLFETIKQLTAEQEPLIGFNYVDDGGPTGEQGRIVRESSARYVVRRARRRKQSNARK